MSDVGRVTTPVHCRLYIYAYTRREKERWYYALQAAAVYMHVPTRHSLEAADKQYRKYMAELVVCIPTDNERKMA
jgi:hypothetical protein